MSFQAEHVKLGARAHPETDRATFDRKATHSNRLGVYVWVWLPPSRKEKLYKCIYRKFFKNLYKEVTHIPIESSTNRLPPPISRSNPSETLPMSYLPYINIKSEWTSLFSQLMTYIPTRRISFLIPFRKRKRCKHISHLMGCCCRDVKYKRRNKCDIDLHYFISFNRQDDIFIWNYQNNV